MASFLYRQLINMMGNTALNPDGDGDLIWSSEVTEGHVMHMLVSGGSSAGGTASANGGTVPNPATGDWGNVTGGASEDVTTMAGFSTGSGTLNEFTSGAGGTPYVANGLAISTPATAGAWIAETATGEARGRRFQAGSATGGASTVWNTNADSPNVDAEGSVIYIWDGSTFGTGVPMVFFNYTPVTFPSVAADVTFNHPADGLFYFAASA